MIRFTPPPLITEQKQHKKLYNDLKIFHLNRFPGSSCQLSQSQFPHNANKNLQIFVIGATGAQGTPVIRQRE